jgi:hypothetical protein
LRGHITIRDGARKLQETVGERGLAVVNVRDDAEIADVVGHMRGKV